MKLKKVIKWGAILVAGAILIGWLSNPEVYGAVIRFFSNLF